jgi:hypothetical protein
LHLEGYREDAFTAEIAEIASRKPERRREGERKVIAIRKTKLLR